MSNVARKLDELDVFQAMGKVTRVSGAAISVLTNRGELRAKRATGCLVDPKEDDFVLVAAEPHGACYVLCVLERQTGGTSIECDGDLEIKLRSGRFRVASQEGIDLASAKEVSVAAGGVTVHAQAASFVLDQLSYLGSAVRAELDKIKVQAGTLDSVFDRLSQRVKRSLRMVEEIDSLKAEHIDYSAKATMSLRAENAVVSAEQLVKLDGDQIHLG